MEFFGYLAAILMGLSLGLIGGGGSILTVPILVYLFLVEPLVATSASLFVVGATALVGASLAFRRGEVDFKTGLLFALPSFVGVYVMKSFLLPRIPEILITVGTFRLSKPLFVMGVFAVLMLLASVTMIRKKKVPALAPRGTGPQKWLSISIQGFVVGGVTGLVGAGGGFLIVPALVNLVGLNMRRAIGTSLTIIAANSLFGFGVSLQRGLMVNWSLLLSILLCSLVGLFVGSRASNRVPEQKLKKGFGYFVLIMGTVILLDQIRRL